MESIKSIICSLASFLSTLFIYLLGGLDIALQSLIVVMIFDFISGIASAFYNKKLSSKVSYLGIIKKLSYFCAIALGVVIDKLTGSTGIIRSLIIYSFVANDGLSIIENLAEMNIKLPQKIIDSLEQIKMKGDE